MLTNKLEIDLDLLNSTDAGHVLMLELEALCVRLNNQKKDRKLIYGIVQLPPPQGEPNERN